MIVRQLLTLLGFQTNLAGANQYQAALNRVQAGANRTASSVNAATGRMSRAVSAVQSHITTQNQRIAQSFHTLNEGLGGFAATMGAGLGGQKALDYMDEWLRLRNKLSATETGVGWELKSPEQLREMAENARSSLDGYVTAYSRFVQSNAFTNEADALRATDIVTKAFATSGQTPQESRATMIQFAQALSAGVLRGEEFNSVMEQSPVLASILRKELKMTSGELRAAAKEGELTSNRIIAALFNSQEDIESRFRSTQITLGQGMAILRDKFVEALGHIDQKYRIIEKINEGFLYLGENIAQVATGITILLIPALIGAIAWMGSLYLATVRLTAALLINPMTYVFLAAAAAIAVLVLAIQDFYVWMQGGDSVFGRFLGPWSRFASDMQALWLEATTMVKSEWDTAVGNFQLGVTNMKMGFADLWSRATVGATDLYNWIDGLLQPLQDAIPVVVQELGYMWIALQDAFNVLVGAFTTILNVFLPGWDTMLQSLIDSVAAKAEQIFAPIRTKWTELTGWMRGAWDSVVGALDIGSAEAEGERIRNRSGQRSYTNPDGTLRDFTLGDQADGARAMGGPVNRGRSYLVGEDGPEVLEMNGGGRVHNARKSAAMLSNMARKAASSLASLSGPMTSLQGLQGIPVPAAAGTTRYSTNVFKMGDIKVDVDASNVNPSMSPDDIGRSVANSISAEFQRVLSSASRHFTEQE